MLLLEGVTDVRKRTSPWERWSPAPMYSYYLQEVELVVGGGNGPLSECKEKYVEKCLGTHFFAWNPSNIS